jgi:hypothetical protein
MKSLIKITGITTLLFLSVNVFAQLSKQELVVQMAEEKSFYFAIENVSQDYLEIIITDGNGVTMFSEYVVHADQFNRTYNLSELKEGKYFLMVKGETTTQVLPIINGEKTLAINSKDIDVVKNSSAPLVN